MDVQSIITILRETKRGKKMKILMVLPESYPPDPRVEKEAKTLVKKGYDLHLLCLNLNNKPNYEIVEGVKVHRINPQFRGISGIFNRLMIKFNPILKKKQHIAKSQNPVKDSLGIINRILFNNIDHLFRSDWYKTIDLLIKKHNYDIIHVHDLPLARTTLAVARKYKKKVIFDMHENWPEAMKAHTNYPFLKKIILNLAVWVYKRQEKLSWKYSNKILVVVKESKDRLIKAGVLNKKIEIIRNSVDSDYFDNNKNHKLNFKRNKSDFIVTYTGTFGTHRGLDIAIKAMAEVIKKNPKVKLLLVGDGPNKSSLQKLARSLNIEKNIIFTGYVNKKYLPSYINTSDVCLILHTSNQHTNSTIPHKLFENMYMGKPVIVTSVKPLKRIVEKENCGLVVNYNHSEVADAILKLTDKKLSNKLGKNGRSSAVKTYTWEVVSKNLEKIYKQLEVPKN